MRTDAPDEPSAAEPEFVSLYQAHFAFVWRTIRGMGASASAVEDLAQEVFVAARRRWSSYDRTRSPRAWLFGIARNEVLAHRRAASRYEQRLARIEPAVPPETPDEVLRRAQGARMIESFLAELDEPMRLSFLLAELEELPGREAAAALGIPLQTHYSRLRAARGRLEAFAARIHGSEPRDGTR